MSRFFSILLLLLLLWTSGRSQSPWPPPLAIQTDTIYFKPIDSASWRLLADGGKTMTIQEVKRLQAEGKFQPGSNLAGTKSPTYWIIYQLENTMAIPARIALNALSDFDEFYVTQGNGKQVHYLSGRGRKDSEKDGLKLTDCIPISLAPGELCKVFHRVEFRQPVSPDQLPLYVVSTDKVIDIYYTSRVDDWKHLYSSKELLEAFIIGMVFLAVFMNLFFYRIVSEKSYLYFAGGAFFLAINRTHDIVGSYWFYRHPDKQQYLIYWSAAWLFITYFFVQFYRSFLNLKARFPRVDRIFIGSAYLFAALFLMDTMLGRIESSYIRQIRLFSVLLLFSIIPAMQILVQFLTLKQAPKGNFILLAGSLPLLVFQASSVLWTPEGLHIFSDTTFGTWLTDNYRLIETVGLTLLIFSITSVLLLRFISLRKQNAQLALEKEREKNELIASQKMQLEKEVAARTHELQESLTELKVTQAQLVQSEKMAALGELTAGIAHEIQNPLNFVNNFSEISVELAEELKTAVEKGESADITAIAGDMQQNLEKIAHHGKRAESIVKGMLQHSKTNTGTKEFTDINALSEEYLRLSYHGLRARNKAFNASFTTNFDPAIGKVKIIPQDISRVLLNLYNNAFYAVQQRKQKVPEGYQPSVHVETRKQDNTILFMVSDNGPGISPAVINKIFQPFFTTKPTGEGTGLGLSLSYDIVKAHGGSITVESAEGSGSTFTVQLPA